VARQLKVWVDHSLCVGNGFCLTVAPGAFAHNADRQSEVVDPVGASAEQFLEAARNCPVSAIRVDDPETGTHLFP
jgi:ferredoxin